MEFSRAPHQKNFLVASSYDKTVRLWEVKPSGQTVSKMMLHVPDPILDVSWSVNGRTIFMVSSDNKLRGWDLETLIRLQAHKSDDVPLKTCHVITGPYYESCIMTSSWDNILKIWDTKCKRPVDTILVHNDISYVDVDYDTAVVCTEQGDIYTYTLGRQIEMIRQVIPPLPSHQCCVSIFRDKKTHTPAGFGLGNREGRVFKIYNHKPGQLENTVWLSGDNQDDNVTATPRGTFDTAVNDIKFHPVHGTLAVARSNGTFSYVDMKRRIVLKESKKLQGQPIQKCCFNGDGQIFAYSTSSDWSKVKKTKPSIFINDRCFDDMNPQVCKE
ncbi:protein Rae1-like [Metopolophium dirhodum]|uniref:protein Rae1-like n=1 Tax=Metopolophium dirhodum TaxID=44670 RepID=UPI0029906651|nr:protein Rae1-like [Metopolophium dirhodum]